MDYVLKGRPSGCIACEALAGGVGPRTLVLHRGRGIFVMLNRYPYNTGHLMICPVRHVKEPSEMTDAELLETMQMVARCSDLLRRRMNAGGINAGLNLGAASGGSVDHMHFHVVPRWVGDTNFMPVVAGTKTLVEMLDATWSRLREEVAAW
jgi:ATP adenylyltransferase